MPVIGTPLSDGAAGFWWTQAALQARWGDINTAVESALEGTAGPDVGTIQSVGDDVDAGVDRLCRAYDYGRPVPATSADYAVISSMAVDILHWRLEGRRGPDLTQAVQDRIKAKEDALWDDMEAELQGATAYAGVGVDFPRTRAAAVTAPAAVYPTVDRDGRTVTSPALGRGPRWDAAAGYWRNW